MHTAGLQTYRIDGLASRVSGLVRNAKPQNPKPWTLTPK